MEKLNYTSLESDHEKPNCPSMYAIAYNTNNNAPKTEPRSKAPVYPSLPPAVDAELCVPCVGAGAPPLLELEPEPEPEPGPEDPEAEDFPMREAFREAESVSNSAKAEAGSVVCRY